MDFELRGGGTVYVLAPLTEAAHEWVAENLPEDATWFGGGVAVEHRYIGDIVEGLAADGLTVE